MHTLILLNDVHSEKQTEEDLNVVRHALVFDDLRFLIGTYDFDRLEAVENDGKPVNAETHWGEIHVQLDGNYKLDLYYAHSDEGSDVSSPPSPGSACTNGSDDFTTSHFGIGGRLPAPPDEAPANLGLQETPDENEAPDENETPVNPDLGVDEDEVY